jgi:hypothetical protein
MFKIFIGTTFIGTTFIGITFIGATIISITCLFVAKPVENQSRIPEATLQENYDVEAPNRFIGVWS